MSQDVSHENAKGRLRFANLPYADFPSECHTAADYEREQFGGWASDAGPRMTPNV